MKLLVLNLGSTILTLPTPTGNRLTNLRPLLYLCKAGRLRAMAASSPDIRIRCWQTRVLNFTEIATSLGKNPLIFFQTGCSSMTHQWGFPDPIVLLILYSA